MILTSILSIELTQNCNLDCKHCLLGEKQNVTITKDIVEKIFDEIKIIECIHFTGGEVFLAYEQMKMVLEVAKAKNVKIYQASMLINGTVYDERIYKLLDEYLKDNYEVGISYDDYHDKSISRIFKNNMDDVKESMRKHYFNSHSTGFKDGENILFDMGKARDLNTPKASWEAIGYFYDIYGEDKMLVGPVVFVSANGYISDGNLEITSYKKHSLGNILEEKLFYMIKRGGIRIKSNDVHDFMSKVDQRHYDFQHRKGKHYTIQNKKMTPCEGQNLTSYYEELNKAFKIFNELELLDFENSDAMIKKLLKYDFDDSNFEDLSQIEHLNV